jgi:hypothetical protein
MGLSRADLLTIAKRTGYPVREAWTAGHGAMGTVVGVIMHHTATPESAPGDYPSLNVVTKGRTGLAGPLCNFGLGRSGTIYCVTEGIAWHAGVGAWKGITDGNGHFLGIEAEHSGDPKHAWPAAQADAYRRLVASILNFLGRNTDWDVRHASWALPPGRKPDFVLTTGIPTMASFDGSVQAMLVKQQTINRTWKPTPAPVPHPLPLPVAKPVESAGSIVGTLPLLTAGMRDPVRFGSGAGMYVGRIQKLLGVPVTGVYDPVTVAKVKSENARLLKRVTDGRTVDAAFWRRIYGMV